MDKDTLQTPAPGTFDQKRYTKALDRLANARPPSVPSVSSGHGGDCDSDSPDNTPGAPGGTTRSLCATLVPADPVEYRFWYRNLMPLMSAAPRADIQRAVAAGLSVGCTRVTEAALGFVADLRFEQLWQLKRSLIGDISSVIALAPGESTVVSIKKTQRTSMTRNVVDSSESMSNVENTQIDKDVLNVARSSTKSQQWRVDSTASISVGAGSLSVSAGYGETTSSTSNTSIQQISEATQKSSDQLKAMQKTEVSQSDEVTLEQSGRRHLQNPYRDRSLMLNVFDLYKEFRVDTGLSEIRPSLALELPALVLDREFVLGNVDFLEAKLLDSSLLDELRSALQTVQRPVDAVDEQEARNIAKRALQYLFFETDVIAPPSAGTTWDISTAYDATSSGFSDAVNNQLGSEMVTLMFYRSLYAGFSPDEQERWAIRIAVTLTESLGPAWAAADPDKIKNVLDKNEVGEALRRLPGFLSLVDKLLKPLLQPIDDARLARDASERAEFVLQRVVDHLGCFQDYYIQHFLEYIFRRTEGLALNRLLYELLDELGRLDLLERFDPERAFLEGNRYVIPTRVPVSLEDAIRWSEELRDREVDPENFKRPPVMTIESVVPTDGVHIEPVAGRCHLEDVPDEPVNVKTTLELSARGSEVLTDG